MSPDNNASRDNIRIAIISAGTAIATALITSFTTIHNESSNLRQVNQQASTTTDQLRKAQDQLRNSAGIANSLEEKLDSLIPLGAVVSSTLPWEEFSKFHQKYTAFSAEKSQWSPCDGRSISGSKLSIQSRLTQAPDLRGVFLRGLNEFAPGNVPPVAEDHADPSHDRIAGSFQADDFKAHAHPFAYEPHALRNSEDSNNKIDLELTGDKSRQVKSMEAGGAETRPKNVAVYYYVRIN